MIGFLGALDVVLLSGCADVESDSLGIELARLGAGSIFGLGGISGDFGLLV